MKIAIGLVNYNFEPFLKDCIDSLLAQTVEPDRIVAGDDRSTDNSWEILTDYQRRYPSIIKIHRTPYNQGAYANGTRVADFLDGDYISLIDGDDCWHPEKLEKEIAAMERTGADVAYSNVNIIDEKGSKIQQWLKRSDVPDCGDMFVPVYGKRIFKDCGNVFRNELLTRKAFEAEGACDGTLVNYWDWDRKIRYARSFRIAFSGEALVDYRIHPNGISKTFGEEKLFGAHVQVYEKHLPCLSNYSKFEQLKARMFFESQVCVQQAKLRMKTFAEYSPLSVLKRLTDIYYELSTEEQTIIDNKYKTEISRIINAAANEAPFSSLELTSLKDVKAVGA